MEQQLSAAAERLRFPSVLAAALLAALLTILILSLRLGIVPIHWTDLPGILLGRGGDEGKRIIVLEMRLPRFCIAALAGAGLATAGCLLQGTLRNDLADPGLLGISAGASLVTAVAVVWQLDIAPGALPLLAMAGGVGAGLVTLQAMRMTRDPAEMILIGAAFAALLSASILLLLVLANQAQIRALYFFLAGSLIGKDADDLRPMLPWIMAALGFAYLFIRPLDLLRLGDDMAGGLGLSTRRMRLLIMLAAIALVAPIVATCGPIGFISLLAPHAARALLGGSDAARVLPLSMLIGAVLLSGTDLLAREVVLPEEWPVGLPMTLLGAPAAIYLIRRQGAR